VKPFDLVLRDAVPHGVLAGVALPGGPEPVPDAVLAQLSPEEREFAQGLRGYRQPEWVGGRLAAHAAARVLGRRLGPILPDERGAPQASGGLALSISHKRDLAVALAARQENGPIGVDLEEFAPERPGVAQKVLTEAELAAVAALPDDRRWTATLLRFSIKEAVYKALAPRLKRYVDFQEAEVEPLTDGTARVELRLSAGPSPALAEARYRWLDHGVVCTVRLRWS
jgi:enterobactin synthetase component D